MQSSVEKVLETYELLERILLQLGSIQYIIRAQLVCRRWRDVIQDSRALQEARWYVYRPHGEEDPRGQQYPATWRLNPVFNSLRVSIGQDRRGPLPTDLHEHGDFDLTERVYDWPGSWTTMLATQPPCRRMKVECHGYDDGGTMYYVIESTTGCLLLGDVMAVLAECQNRQECGEDRFAGVRHYTGRLFPVTEANEDVADCEPILQAMSDDVSIKVVVGQAWDSGEFPAFSLRRVHPPPEHDPHDPASYMDFLHELVVHKMVWNGYEYKWEWDGEWDGWDDHAGLEPDPEWRDRRVCELGGEYEANLLAVRSHEGEYLAKCRHIFRLLSEVEV